jgi:membrane protein DedA with SNARE-associated domain
VIATSSVALVALLLLGFVLGRSLLYLPGRLVARLSDWWHRRQLRKLELREREAEIKRKEAEAENEAARILIFGEREKR